MTMAPERVTFATADGVRLVAHAYVAASDAPWALLLHMMPATKESWEPLAQALGALGVNALAIDERGHGETVDGPAGKLDFRDFTDVEHQAKQRDVEAAVSWLTAERGAVRSRIALCGASIGANLALAYAASDPRLPAVVALSPGLDYRGVTTEDKIVAMPASTKVFLAASDDDEESTACVRLLAAMRPGVTLRELRGAGHGTRMFEAEPAFLQEVAEWLRRALRAST